MVEYGIRDTDLLFTSRAGTALSRNNFRTKFWVPAVEKAKLEHGVTFHNLRAAHASWLLAGGADIVVVQERLGHPRITTTPQYTGTLPDAGDRALAGLPQDPLPGVYPMTVARAGLVLPVVGLAHERTGVREGERDSAQGAGRQRPCSRRHSRVLRLRCRGAPPRRAHGGPR